MIKAVEEANAKNKKVIEAIAGDKNSAVN